jgi:thymidylate kinase
MAFNVIIDGKPCAGKTTLAKAVEAKLSMDGISTLDAKSYALEKGVLSGFLRKFSEGEIDSFRTLGHSAVYHTLSYVALEQSEWVNNKKYDVILLQRSPYAFTFMIEAAKIASGKYESYEVSGLLYNLIKAWAGVVKPDLFIYLKADTGTLMERFKNRSDGKDRVHKTMIKQDDSRHIELLKSYVGDSRFKVIYNDSSIDNAVTTVSATIKEALSLYRKDPSSTFGSNSSPTK